MDFELASMLAESGLTFQEFQKRGMTKAQLRLSLASSEDDDHEDAKQDSVPELKSEPTLSPKSEAFEESPVHVRPVTVPRTPKEPVSTSAELTEEMAVNALVALSKESQSPRSVKRQRLESGPRRTEASVASLAFGNVPSYSYYQQMHQNSHMFAQPQLQWDQGYQGNQGYQGHQQPSHPYQAQPYQPGQQYDNLYNYYYNQQHRRPGYPTNQMQQVQQVQQVHHTHQLHHQLPLQQGAGYPSAPVQLPSTPKTSQQSGFDPRQAGYTMTTNHRVPSLQYLQRQQQVHNGAPTSALTNSAKINIEIRNAASRSHEETWLRHFNSLQDHLERYREYPTHSKAHPSTLGQWCGRQRKHYRRVGPYRNGNPMPPHRIELMELLPGWRWEGSPAIVTAGEMAHWKPVRLSLPPEF